MSDEVKEEKETLRQEMYRAAMWAGFEQAEEIVSALRDGKRPWFKELAPLTAPERVFVMAQICKYFFPEMTGENEKKAFQMLGRLYGLKRSHRTERRHAH